MRHPIQRFLLLLSLALFTTGARAWADDRSDARAHYQAGVKAYAAADYKKAITEFSAAQQLVPADLNNYNLALCYDKLGDAEPAIQYYRAFLDKQPNADKRSEIEASIARLEAAVKSAAAKKADEQRKADEAKAAEAKKAEDARKAEQARRDEDARKAAGAGGGAAAGGAAGGAVVGGAVGGAAAGGGVAVGGGAAVGGAAASGGVQAGVGSTGTPGTGETVSTGDAQLDRVNAINIDQVRDQRMGGASSGMVDPRAGGPGVGAQGAVGVQGTGSIPPGPQGAVGPNGAPQGPQQGVAQSGPQGPQQGAAGQALPADKPKETPVYKKWWFWAVVAVSAYVVISIATESSNNPNATGHQMLPTPGAQTSPGGLTLWRF